MASEFKNLSGSLRRMGPPQLDEASAALVVEQVKELLARYKSQTALARALEVSQSAVSQWLRGSSRPSYTNALRVAEVAGIPVERVLALPNASGDPFQMGHYLESKPNLRAAVDLYKEERPGEEGAVRAVCLASVHLPDLDRGMWLSMLEQVQSRQPAGGIMVKRKK